MQALIVADFTSHKGQQAFFFQEEEYGMSLNFAHRDTKNKARFNWTKVPYKVGFIDHLQKYGVLPVTNTQDLLELQLQNHQLKEAMMELTGAVSPEDVLIQL